MNIAERPTPSIAVIGGSGLYSLFDPAASRLHRVDTPYGSVDVTLGELDGRATAFLPRHGASHSVAPHLINFRANIWALASLGVKAIISSAAVGSLSPEHPVGSLVLTDQYIDRTSGRADTFYDRGSVQHLPSSEPFCPGLLAIARKALGGGVVAGGTVAVIQGPRFSTAAESRWLAASGAHIVNMTLYPEVPLAAELNVGMVNLAFVTDSDARAAEEDLSAELVFARLREAQPRIIASIAAIAAAIPENYAARQLIEPTEVDAVLARATA